MPSRSSSNADRSQALTALVRWEEQGVIPERAADADDASALARELIQGCLRHMRSLDAWIDHLSHHPPGPRIRPALRLGLYQILLLDGIADHAAVHETLEAAKRQRLTRSEIGFANALLRRALRERDALLHWMDGQDASVRWSHPDRLFRQWQDRWGTDTAIDLCRWNQQRSTTLVRRTARGKAADAGEPLPDGCGIHPHFPSFIRLPRGLNPVSLPGFDAGHWYVQDPSTTLAPTLLAPRPGETVLDACAAPGGKTALLAEAMDGGLGLLATEPNPGRLSRLRENLTRLRLGRVNTLQADLQRLAPQRQASFDAVLLDVPCSNTGVLQRRPEARWRYGDKGHAALITLQRDLLDLGASTVKPGGRLVYSTCSIEADETSDLVDSWLASHADWDLAQSTTLLPGEQECDGAYMALLHHKAT